MKKRILSMLLVIVMVLSLVPVSALADSITITSTKGSVVVGEKIQLTAEGANATDDVKWSVEGDGVALSSDTGRIVEMEGQRQGKVTVKATIGTTKSGERTYTVYQQPVDLAIIDKDTDVAPVTNLTIGDKLKLGYTCTNEGTMTEKSMVWESTRGTVVTVDSTTGELEALGAGEATVTLRFNGERAELKFVVSAPVPKKMTVKADGELYTGKTVQLRAYGEDNTELTGVKWWCPDKAVAIAGHETGALRCLTAGDTKVVAKKDGYENVELPITIKQNYLQIDGLAETLYKGDKLQLKAVDAEGTEVKDVTWESSAFTTASVDPTGLLSCNSQGTAKIKVTANVPGYNSKEQDITVGLRDFAIADADGKVFEDGKTSIYAGDEMQLTAIVGEEAVAANWVSKDPGFATVSTEGKLKGVAAGKATIEASKDGYGTKTIDVTVLSKATFIKLRLDDKDVRPYDLAVDETRGLEALKDTSGIPVEGVEWKITNGEAFAKLEGDQLTGLADGDVELTATCAGFESKTVTIHVTTEELVTVTIPNQEMNEGQEIALSEILKAATFNPTYATDKTIQFTSDKTDVLDIVDGKLVAKKFGTAIVTGTYAGDKTTTFEVKVKAANGIEVDPTMPLELICGESMNLQAVLKNAAGETLETPVQWRLKNDNVIKNLVDLTANKLTAYPQSTYDFTVELEAFVDDDKVEVVEVPIHVIPRTTNIILMNDTEDISEKTIVLNVNDPNGITIDAVTRPSDARQIVDWQITGPNDIFKPTRGDSSIVIQPVSAQKTGTITLTATAKDGTGISRKTTIVFAKMADNVLITNAPKAMRGGANIQLRTNLDEDKTITDRRVEWSVVGGDNQYASVTKDGFLDTAKVTDRVMVSLKATMIANPEKTDVKDIWLCPAVNLVKIVMEDGTQTNAKSVVNFADGTIQLDKIAYPAGHIGSEKTDPVGAFVWTSSNEKIATVEPDTGLVTLHDAGSVRISCTAYDTDYETALKIASGEIRDDSKVMAIGYKTLEIVKTAGAVEIIPPVSMPIDDEDRGHLISGKNAVLTAAVYTGEDYEELAANQKVTWSVEDVYGNPTKAATINSRGRLYAKTVNYGTEVVVYATSVENKNVVGEFHVMIQPKKERTFAAFLEDDNRIIEAPLYMNPNETAVISGQWYIRDIGFDPAEDCLFYSSNRSVASIDEHDGTLNTLKTGSTTITVRATDPDTRNVYTAKFTLHVVNTVDHIVISKPNNTPNYVRSGSYMNLSATVWSNVIETIKADNQGVTWGVYEEDGDDLVATKAAYMTSNGALVAYSVTENTPVVVVATSKENPSITAEFPMQIRPAKFYTVTTRCMDEDSGDMVVPTGPVNLEVESAGTYFTSEIEVEVYVSDPNSAYDGDILPSPVITWETSDKKIVKVVNGQLVYTGATGKVKVTPTFKVGSTTYRGNAVTLNIMKFVDSIEVTKKYANQELYSGKSLIMYAIVDENATTRRVTWSLIGEGDEAFASINPTTGLIRAKKGLTKQETITVQAMATDGSGETSDPVPVTIYPLATKVTIKKGDKALTTLQMVNGTTENLTVEFTPVGEANNTAVKWISSRSSVVSVDKEGNITAKRKGTATIKATATDGSGKYATIKVTVK